MLKLSLLLVFLNLLLVLDFHGVTGDKTEFDFGTLSLSSLKLLGDAHLNNGSVRLTRDLAVPNSGSGRVLYSNPVRFRRPGTHLLCSFSTFFSFSISNLNPSSVGGGLAFLISPDDETIGESGGLLGLKGSEKGFVGVEFDTLMDLEFDDINGNHVGLDLNSLISAQVVDLDTVEIDLKSGNLVNAWIDYDGPTQMFNVSVSYSNLRPKKPLFSFHVDLNRFVKDFMFVGFSGSTQGSTESHSIEWWSFSSSFSTSSSSGSPPSSTTASFFGPPTANFTNSTSPSSPPSDSVSSFQDPVNTSKSSSCHNQLCKRKPMAIAGVVAGGVCFLVIFACFLIWVFTKRFRFVKKSDSLSLEIIKAPKEFSYKDLKSATKCFNSTSIIGHGAFGTVYKGIIPGTGSMIAVKRCRHSGGQGKAEFLSELSIIGTLRHRNLVRLQGWCHEKGEILLVYDFMPNGSLDKALFEAKIPLPWLTRKRILMGVASALAYLHQECENQVIHRDIKASNIMLDEYFNARLGDFGLAKQIEHDKSPDATIAAGTMGYLAPEYLLTGRATDKTDVFSFGAVVLEVITGRRPIERDVSKVGGVGVSSNLVEFVWNLHREGRLLEAVDVKIAGEFDEGDMMKVILVGLACSNPDPSARPTMRCVVQMLLGEAEVPIVPKSKPSMCFSTTHLLLSLQDSVSDCNEMITISTSSSSDDSFNGGGKI
ncbi:Protein kinase domain [Macleaya cordata]|uniref:non-specific serine/threonine protein kinase n=1 Tax=Macleaya cordata TaxID=56857 RepID=A0A200R5Z2_MACCD|nr:Protein kinase domain [Macleaya cordata]